MSAESSTGANTPIRSHAPTLPRSHAPALEAREVTKRFPGVLANDRVSFAVARGEIHALPGQNGAGKSTLLNVLYGLYQPEQGAAADSGGPVRFGRTLDAI